MRSQRGTGLVVVAFAVALILIIAAFFLSAKKTNAPTQTTSGLNQASSELNTTDVDSSLDPGITQLDTDSSSF